MRAKARAVAVAPMAPISAVSTAGVFMNDANRGLPTDYWLAHCAPSQTKPATDPANWRNETRLTDRSFDLGIQSQLNSFLTRYFLGDYQGLATVGSDFLAVWSQPYNTDPNSVLYRRVGL